MTSSSIAHIVERILALGPFLNREAAERALWTVLEALNALLTSDERERIAAVLPAELAQTLRPVPAAAGDPGLFERVAQREHVSLGRAIELSEIALHALGEALPSEVRSRLERDLPELASLLEPVAPLTGVEATELLPRAAPHDLASGRPGSRRPLADADPRLLSHANSVARSDDPHAETKLSSAQGLTQEREGETLAAGRPVVGCAIPAPLSERRATSTRES